MSSPEDVLGFWFGHLDDASPLDLSSPEVGRWFGKNDAFDREIRGRFEADHLAAAAGSLDDWARTPRGAVALVILLDQLPRNMYRGMPHAFATDARALEVSERTIAAGLDELLPLIYRSFLYMPFMHAECLDAQERGVRAFALLAELARARSPGVAAFFRGSHEYARRHRDIVERFGRFPHRNAILGRPSTPEEIEFLKQPGSSF
jgi:uncharacterized protein (DUF924 family)